MNDDWTGHDYLAARLAQQPQGYLLNGKQRADLRRYLLRSLPAAALNPGEAGHGEAIRAAITRALQERVLPDVFLSSDPATVARLYAETAGLGPLDALLADPAVTSITANGPGLLMVEYTDHHGLAFAPGFDSEDSLLRAMDALAQRAGRNLSPAEPLIDLVWDNPDGASTRAHLNLLGRKAPFLALRRGRTQAFHLDHYVAGERMSGEVATFLAEAVRAGVSIAITGTPGSGKTALLEALLHLTTPAQGHVVLIEDDPEVNVQGLSHVSAFQVPKPRPGQETPIGFLGLVLASLRMNCRSILVCGEVRGAEAGAIIAVMPSYKAVWLTVHGTSPVDGLERLVAAAQMGGTRPPSPFSGGRQEHLVRRNLASGLQLIVQMDRLADDRIGVAGVYWLAGAAGTGLAGDGSGWDLAPVFLAHQTVRESRLIVAWEANPDFHWPDEIAARLAMAELQGAALDETAFQAEMSTARAALEGNQAPEAARRLASLYAMTSGREQRRAVLQMLHQALLAQPARWQALLAAARQTKDHLERLARNRDWEPARQALDAAGRDPEAAVALEQTGVEAIRSQVAAGLDALAAFERAAGRARQLAAREQHWEALSLLATLPLEKLPPRAISQATGYQAEQLRRLQARAETDGEDASRVARAILRLLPATCHDLHRWAADHSSGEGPAAEESLADLLPPTRLTPLPTGSDEQETLYHRACVAWAAGDRGQARRLFEQLGTYRGAHHLLERLEQAAAQPAPGTEV
jgi:Flp pilus assembly CpaF family ATPase